SRSTVSELTLGGLVKHVSATEQHWARFIQEGPAENAIDWADVDWSNPPAEITAYSDGFRMLEDETLAGLLEEYDAVAAATDARAAGLPPPAARPRPRGRGPPAGPRGSARGVFAHTLADTAQHAGHADITREATDGQKTMGCPAAHRRGIVTTNAAPPPFC